MSPRLQTKTPGLGGDLDPAAPAADLRGRRARPGRGSSAARSPCARRRPTPRPCGRRVAEDAEEHGRVGVRCRSNQSRSSPRPSAMPRSSSVAERGHGVESSRAPRRAARAGRGGNRFGPCRGARPHPRIVGAELRAEVEPFLAGRAAGGQLAAEREPAPPRPSPRGPSRAARLSRRRAGRRTGARGAVERARAAPGSTP